jgi:methyltransferase (TIGR00027 family)
MDAVAKTAYYCCGVRAEDAGRERPVCGDAYARLFMDGEAQKVFERFRRFTLPNRSNVARHRVIDDILREQLSADPTLPVVLLGAGFDTRAFRLQGGAWLELDRPELIAVKEAKLPSARAPRPLQRRPTDFTPDDLARHLSAWRAPGVPIVILEGVTMYVAPAAIRSTLQALRQAFPRHLLVCDLMTRHFAERFGHAIRHELARLGARFAQLVDDPQALVASAGYALVDKRSIVGSAVDFGSVAIPRLVLATVLRSLRDGYQVYRFATNEG